MEEYEEVCRSGIPYLGGDHRPTTDRCKEVLKHLSRIIPTIKRNSEIRQDFFDNGSKLAVIGAPIFNTTSNKVQIVAFDILEDRNSNRNLEINFKQTLYEFYTNKYLK